MFQTETVYAHGPKTACEWEEVAIAWGPEQTHWEQAMRMMIN